MSRVQRDELIVKLTQQSKQELAKSVVGTIRENELLYKKNKKLIELKAGGREDIVQSNHRLMFDCKLQAQRIGKLERQLASAHYKNGILAGRLHEIAARNRELKNEIDEANAGSLCHSN